MSRSEAIGKLQKQNLALSAGVTAAKAQAVERQEAIKEENRKREKKQDLANSEAKLAQLNFRQKTIFFAETSAFNTAVAYEIQNPAPRNSAQAAALLQYQNQYKSLNNQRILVEKEIDKEAEAYALIVNNGKVSARAGLANRRQEYQVRKALKDAKNKKGGVGTKPPVKPTPDTSSQGDIRFNAPMVKGAYFRDPSVAVRALVPKAVLPMLRENQGKAGNSLNTFGPFDTNRGFIVPNKIAREAALKKLSTSAAGLVGGFKIPFGFRFHYNPQNVQQTYGTLTDLSPELIMSGADQANMITTPTQSSTISFSLYLNRIEDMNALTNIQHNGGDVITSKNSEIHYPEKLTDDDIKLIRDFGTMYDLDFLFKTINGEMNGYKSPLRGIKTGDIGWLNGMAVELHLGRKLRYLARILNISINHILFTESMIPTLSIVNIQCHRFHDTTQIDVKK